MLEIKSQSREDTQRAAKTLAEKIKNISRSSAVVLAMKGDLGAGKTSFTQALADVFGIKEKISSPTFVILKIYELKNKSRSIFAHIDCYRLGSSQELEDLGFKKLIQNREAVVVIEWADRMIEMIPKDAIWIEFEHGKGSSERIIKIKI